MVEQDLAHDSIPLDQVDEIHDIKISLELSETLAQVQVIASAFNLP